MSKLLNLILLNKAFKEKKGGGIEPTGTINISENGEYDVTNYATANVDVSGSEFNTKLLVPIGNNSIISKIETLPIIDLSNRQQASGLFNGFNSLKNIKLINTSSLTNISQFFQYCQSFETVELFDTSNVTNMSSMFNNANKVKTVPLFNTSKVTSMQSMFSGCIALISCPQFDTSLVTAMDGMFRTCINLIDVPIFNTSRVTNMTNMFNSCNSLSNESLNNIMAMCINATSYTLTKELKTLGLTSSQATICQTLSNYQDFVNAGWTTGY